MEERIVICRMLFDYCHLPFAISLCYDWQLVYNLNLNRSRSSMDRAPDFESVGCAFESRRER